VEDLAQGQIDKRFYL